jgi:hypothetical protein
MSNLVILILIAAMVWLYYRDRKSTRRRKTRTRKGWRARLRGWSERIPLKSWRDKISLRGWRPRLPFRGRRRKRQESPQQFKKWVASAALAERKTLYKDLPKSAQGFTTWLDGLATPETRLLCHQAADFCADFDLELAWLLDGQLDEVAELKQAVEEIVALYGLAHWKATQAQGNIKTFATYRAWQEDPFEEQHRELNQKLFAKLVEKKLVPAPSPELFMTPEQEREAYVVQTIRQVAEDQREAFNAILEEIVAPAPASTEEPKKTRRRGRKPKEEAAPPAPATS